MPEFMRRHLTQAQHRVVALEAMVVRLFLVVVAGSYGAWLRGCELLETSGVDRVSLLVLATMGDHFVGIRAHKVALHAVEVGRFVLLSA